MGNHAEASGRLARIRPGFAEPTDALAVPVEHPRADNPARRLQVSRDAPLCVEKLSQCREVIAVGEQATVSILRRARIESHRSCPQIHLPPLDRQDLALNSPPS